MWGKGESPIPPPLSLHPQNNLSNFAEKAVAVLSAKGKLDWERQDTKGYTPLMLAAFHGNVWLVRHLIDDVKVDPNDPSQRTKEGAPMVRSLVVVVVVGLCL